MVCQNKEGATFNNEDILDQYTRDEEINDTIVIQMLPNKY